MFLSQTRKPLQDSWTQEPCVVCSKTGNWVEPLSTRKKNKSSKERSPHRKQRILLLGSGIRKSFSPAIHQKALLEVGFPAKYKLLDVAEAQFGTKLKEIRASEDVLGFNVTIPYKEKILPFITHLDDQAKFVGAVNTVMFDAPRNMNGFNTDVDGVTACLSRLGFTGRVSGKRTVILGAGGAARACAYAAILNGFHHVILLNRTEARARDLAREFGHKFPSAKFDFSGLSKKHLDDNLAGDCDLLINSIPPAEIFPFRTELETAPSSMKYFDLNYRGVTPLMKIAADRGLETINGLLMLVEQAARSFEIWTGTSAPRKTMMLEAQSLISSKKAKKKSR
jgi:shikimate dehydrogenase